MRWILNCSPKQFTTVNEAIANLNQLQPEQSKTKSDDDSKCYDSDPQIDFEVPAMPAPVAPSPKLTSIRLTRSETEMVSRGHQVRMPYRSKETQTTNFQPDLTHTSVSIMEVPSTPETASTPQPKYKRKRSDSGNDEETEPLAKHSLSFVDDETKDPSWNPNMSLESVASTSDANNKRASSSLTEGMCAVSVSKLLELFHICYNCGSMVTITQSCLSCDVSGNGRASPLRLRTPTTWSWRACPDVSMK
ncbi:uncharacterized protein LOC135498933 isoform X2 [Lineus longissimus]|uniref:uncharacterized protein LOC135498933 isoform X2 n=1 Tax=Lineus longissimus TaxID=88925 RepID=UPI00315CF5BF